MVASYLDSFALDTDAKTFLNWLEVHIKAIPLLAPSWQSEKINGGYLVTCGFYTGRAVDRDGRVCTERPVDLDPLDDSFNAEWTGLAFKLITLSSSRVEVHAGYEGAIEALFRKILIDIYDSYSESRDSLGEWGKPSAKWKIRMGVELAKIDEHLKSETKTLPEPKAVETHLSEYTPTEQTNSTTDARRDVRFRRMQVFLLALDHDFVFLFVDDTLESVRSWFERYNIVPNVPTRVDGLNMMVNSFRPIESTVFMVRLQSQVIAIKWDSQASANRMEPAGGIYVKLEQRPHGDTWVTLAWDKPIREWCERYLACLLADMSERWPGVVEWIKRQEDEAITRLTAKIASDSASGGSHQTEKNCRPAINKPYGPTERIIGLANDIKKLKDANPTLTQSMVATQMNLPVETVRNAYRLMGWKWERADRTRPKR